MGVVFFLREHVGTCRDECSNGTQWPPLNSNVQGLEAAPGARPEALRLVCSQEVDYQAAAAGLLGQWLPCGSSGRL